MVYPIYRPVIMDLGEIYNKEAKMIQLSVGARESELSQIQVTELFSRLSDVDYRLVSVRTYGDVHCEIPLEKVSDSDFFTREIDRMLLDGICDVAVHSAKDLPFPLPEKMEVVALIQAFDQTDALVTQNNVLLKDLPRGAVVGTSSERRREQLKELRSDLIFQSIRGDIRARLRQLDEGKFQAVVIATCALKRLGLEERIAEILSVETHPLQGMLAVTALSSRRDMKALFYSVDYRNAYGRVFLLGAGVGDAELISLKADRILKRAEVIFYDALIPQGLIQRYPQAQLHCVGKRAEKHSKSQREINELLYRSVKAGKFTVRLKGGDPFVFGRGGEELLYFRKRLVDVEVIPGVTTAQVLSARYQAPLTLRGVSSSVGFYLGHPSKEQKIFSGKTDTTVFYMGASSLNEISHSLLENGVNASDPALLVSDLGSVKERSVLTDIGGLSAVELETPLILMTGFGVGFGIQPKKMLYTGLDSANPFVPKGYTLVHLPLILVIPKPIPIDFSEFQTLLFTSRTAVDVFCTYYSFYPKKVFVIGSSTRQLCQLYGFEEIEMLDDYHSDVLAESIEKAGEHGILYPCSSLSRNAIHVLEGVKALPLYEVSPLKVELPPEDSLSAVFFSSPSTVKSYRMNGGKFSKELLYYTMGRVTARELNKFVPKESIVNVQEV